MPQYKLYFRGPAGRIEERIDIEAADDAAALRLAENEADGRIMELWQNARLVATGIAAVASLSE